MKFWLTCIMFRLSDLLFRLAKRVENEAERKQQIHLKHRPFLPVTKVYGDLRIERDFRRGE